MSATVADYALVSLAQARAAIAACMRPEQPVSARVGRVVLRDDQRATARRASAVLSTWGGVLLGDTTGAGKTYIALAVADAQRAHDLLVIAPASLRSTWRDALQRAQREARIVSIERLGRGSVPVGSESLVIIDEAHHLRNPRAQRTRQARALCARRPVVLLSATPLHNTAQDLTTLLSLFLGAHAADLTDAERGALLVRGEPEPRASPRLITHAALRIRDEAAISRAILALPPPVPPRDGGIAVALWQIALLRAWCSSAAALRAMLRRAELAAGAWLDATTAGRDATRAALRAWGRDDGQLAWPALLAAPAAAAAVTAATTTADATTQATRLAAGVATRVADIAATRGADVAATRVAPIDVDPSDAVAAMTAHRDAIAALRVRLRDATSSDRARADAVCDIAARHAGVPVLACAQYAATVDMLWQALRHRPGVAALTASGGRIASGRIARQALLDRFAPLAQGVRPPPLRERVMLLLTTDVVSEGLNLQDAGVILHLDTPWTPARITQRDGRLRRPASPHPEVHRYTLQSARAATTLLALEQRLARKQRAATDLRALADASRDIQRELTTWATGADRAHDRPSPAPLVAAMTPHRPHGPSPATPPRAITLVCLLGDPPTLLASTGSGALTDDPRCVAEAVRQVGTASPCEAPPAAQVARALDRVARALARRAARDLAMTDRSHAARAARSQLDDLRAAVASGAAHHRTTLAQHSAARLHSLAPRPRSDASARSILAVVSSFERTSTTAEHPRR